MKHDSSRFIFCWSRCMCTWFCCHPRCAQGYDDKLMHEWQGLSSSTYKLCTKICPKKHTRVFDYLSRSMLSRYVSTIKRCMNEACMKNKKCQEFHTDYFHCGRQLLQLSKEVAKHQWLNVIDSHDKRTYVGCFVDTNTIIEGPGLPMHELVDMKLTCTSWCGSKTYEGHDIQLFGRRRRIAAIPSKRRPSSFLHIP